MLFCWECYFLRCLPLPYIKWHAQRILGPSLHFRHWDKYLWLILFSCSLFPVPQGITWTCNWSCLIWTMDAVSYQSYVFHISLSCSPCPITTSLFSISCSTFCLKPGINLFSLAVKVLDSIFFQYEAVLSALKISCLVQLSSSIAWGRSAGQLVVASDQHLLLRLELLCYGGLLSFSLMDQPLLASDLFYSFLTSLSLVELERVRVLLWIRLWLKAMLWLVWFFYPDHHGFLHISNESVSLSYQAHGHESGTLNFLQ